MSTYPTLTIGEIIEAIRSLTPAQRRQLQRRLRASGIFEVETLLSDQRRLDVAPALGKRAVQPHTAGAGEPKIAAPTPATSPSAAPGYRSPVSGRVVMGAPNTATAVDDPHAMPPLPGQAPEHPIEIIFDGGSKGNPGQGYGSYVLRWPGIPQQIVQLRFGDRVTNNEAEYDTLIAALEATLKRLQDGKVDPATARLVIGGDSQVVVNQVLGEWQCKDPRLQVRRDHVRELLRRFGHWRISHHPRETSVEILGH